MSELAQPFLGRIERISAVWDGWRPGTAAFDRAAGAAVAAFDYVPNVVERQLLACGSAFTAGATPALDLAASELCPPVSTGSRGRESSPTPIVPSTLLHLAGPAIPGLLCESISWGLILGSRQLVHASLEEAVLAPWLDHLAVVDPELRRLVEVVDSPPWAEIDGAIVHGADATIDHVRAQLGSTAPVAAFGSREAIVVISERGLDEQPHWDARLRDDLTRFRGAGCMTPRHVWLLGTSSTLQDAADHLAAVAAERADALTQRRHADDAVLDALVAEAAAAAGEPVIVTAASPVSEAGLQIALQPDRPSLERAARGLGTRLQTAVLICGEHERAPLAELLTRCGVTRICLAGSAHDPSPWWPQDGRGRLRDLVRWSVVEA